MSKDNKNTLMLCAFAVVGGYMLMQRRTFDRRPLAAGRLGDGSMAGSVGSGAAQAASGILGALGKWAANKVDVMINSNPNPRANDPVPAYDETETNGYVPNQIVQNMNLDRNPAFYDYMMY